MDILEIQSFLANKKSVNKVIDDEEEEVGDL